MKHLQFTLTFIVFCLFAFSPSAHAQWSLSGNTGAAGHILGTNNAFPVKFVTNSVERMRLPFGTTPSTLIIGTTPIVNGFYDLDGNAASIKLSLDIQNTLATTYGANVGAHAKTSTNGTTSIGFSEAYLASSSSWAAGGSFQGVGGVTNFTKLAASSGNSAAFGGGFITNMTAAQLSSTGTFNTRVTGVYGGLTGTIATYPTNGFVTAVAGVDGINTNNTWAGYFSGKVYCSSSLFVASDLRFKSNVQTIRGSLDLISKMRGVSYEYDQNKFADRSFIGGKTDGFIAQELCQIMPELVHEGNDGFLAVNYIGVIPVLTEAVKELKAQKDAEVSHLEEQIADKDRQINDLAARMAKLEALVADSRTGTISVSEKMTMATRPNPFSDVTTVSFNLSENVQNAALLVTDLQGKVVLQQTVEARGQGKTTLSLNGMASGTYICTLLADGQPVATTKLSFQNN